MHQTVKIVIGRGYGDEGKGLATDWICSNARDAIVVKHNGGAQAGHTVDLPSIRFIFHQLGSGSFRHADTFWAHSYLPDLFKLREEFESFREIAGFAPRIYADPNTSLTLIFDVIINQALETLRGDARHGSCGMGINEADLRTKAGYGLKISDLVGLTPEALAERMRTLRDAYVPRRKQELEVTEFSAEFEELLTSDEVLYNAAEEMLAAFRLVTLVAEQELLPTRETVVFETGQGLLLDGCLEANFPHVTASRTGLTNPVEIIKDCHLANFEVIYVARSYVTRHGEGPLLYEVTKDDICKTMLDLTNQPNPWQGTLRYGLYGSVEEFLRPIHADLEAQNTPLKASLLITHLNETAGSLRTMSGPVEVSALRGQGFTEIYCSFTPFATDILPFAK